MLNYPSTLPAPVLDGNSENGGETFIRSEFDYGVRQREAPCGTYIIKRTFILKSDALIKEFKDFYYTGLIRGLRKFKANWNIEGNTSIKEFRFSKIYSTKRLAIDKYEVSCEFELMTKIEGL